MDTKICTNVNNLVYLYENMCNDIETLKTSVEDNSVTIIPDLNDSHVIVKSLTADDIIVNDDLTAICGNITCKNLTADQLITDNFNADDIVCDKCTADVFIGCTAHITNVYSTKIETQTCAVISDKKMKKEITYVNKDRLKELKPVRFKYKNNDAKYVYGLIAQEVEPIYPDMIFTLENGNKAIDYNQLISLLILKTNDIEERLSSIEQTQASIKTFTGLLILTLFIILILLFLPRKYLNFRYLLRLFTGK